MTTPAEAKNWPVSEDSAKSDLHPEIETTRVRERDTNLLYDAQVFEDAALVRQVGFSAIEMQSIDAFEDRFEESYVAR